MNRPLGRSIYIIHLEAAIAHAGGLNAFVKRCQSCSFSSIWIRLGQGAYLDKNLLLPSFPQIRAALAAAGIQVWGWHIPHGASTSAATDEAKKVCTWVLGNHLDGLIWDAEEGGLYFLGGRPEAEAYASSISAVLKPKNIGIALSSHDQPNLHQGFPFEIFLKYAIDNCPQVYYSTEAVATRLDKSIRAYRSLEAGRNFTDRYKPVGNITIHDEGALPSTAACLAKAADFMQLVETNGFKGYGFWCWDDSPEEIWPFLAAHPAANADLVAIAKKKPRGKFRA